MAAMCVAFGTTVASAAVPLPASVVDYFPPIRMAAYPGVDFGSKPGPKDDRSIRTTWRIAEGTGNCCETLLTTTPGGRLLDFGGSYVTYSDDRGETWKRVMPIAPLVNGEGAIVAAPGGDVLGVEWDPYSGDHLQFYKYEGDTGTWQYTEMPLHQPFYDREWIAVVPGPITIDGETHEYVSFVKGGFPWKEAWFYSTDGLTYTEVTSKYADRMLSGTVVDGALPTATHLEGDWIQPNTRTGITPLGQGRALAAPDLLGGWSLLDGGTFKWSSFTFPNGEAPSGRYQTDSAGRLHNVRQVSQGTHDAFEYRISSNGGESWTTAAVELPVYHYVEALDFRANRDAGVAALSVRAHDASTGFDQDLVFKLDITGATARVLRRYEVGLGDVDARGGFGNDVRFDFASVAIFPDGRLAVSFLDSTTYPGDEAASPEPAIAIERDTEVGKKIPPPPEQPPPVLGAPYDSFTFDTDAEGWTAAGIPTWSRSGPGAAPDGSDDPAESSFGIVGAQYVDQMDATLTSPPVATDAGRVVVEFWTKMDIEEGFDFLSAQWSADGTHWLPLTELSGESAGYPAWERKTYAFDAPGGNVRLRFRLTSDQLCSGLNPICGLFEGVRVDEVVVGRQAG